MYLFKLAMNVTLGVLVGTTFVPSNATNSSLGELWLSRWERMAIMNEQILFDKREA